jgi:cation diffusion facilitator family transporter
VRAGAQADVRRAGVKRVLLVTLFLNLLVSGSKILVGVLSGSLSMVADGYHSLLDGSNNVIGLFVAAFAYAPPDRGHPYGHRKFENAATIFIGAALLALSYEVVQGALGHVGGAALPEIGPWNWAVMIGTMAVNVFVSSYETREGRRLGSEFLLADATHTRADLYSSLGVIASFAGAKARLAWADAVVAVAIAALIAVQAVKILVSAFHVLTDRAVIPEEAIASILRGMTEVREIREVRTRGSPDAVYLDLVVHLDGDLTLEAAHRVADRIEQALKQARAEIVDVVVHLEPAGS